MRKRWPFIILLIVFLSVILLTPRLAAPRRGHLTLLTVVTGNGTARGGTADVYLDIKPGTGNVYITTFPFTKLDTQISTRFANEIACAFLDAPCDQYDFFYTIKADSTIIGGPSAGAALTALTVALLDDHPIDQGVAVTGTINTGGIVGPVGGIADKAWAAQDEGLHTVIVPRWEKADNASVNQTNATLPEDIAVINVTTVAEILTVLTGHNYARDITKVPVPHEYTQLMRAVADQLCNRSQQILAALSGVEQNDSLLNQSMNYLADADRAGAAEQYYSQASYCFSANLRLRELQVQNFSQERLVSLRRQLAITIQERIDALSRRELKTFNDLQTKAIVDERLRGAADYVHEENVTAHDVAYAVERYRSAIIWSNFFALPGERLILDDDHLKAACEQKLAEVEERKSYVSLLFGPLVSLDGTELEGAYQMHREGDYALCLFKASKAKAQVDVIISSMAVDKEQYQSLIAEKLRIAEQLINQEWDSGCFPLMGYSYYEYAGSLQEDDPYIASLFASYALELSDLRMYFSPDDSFLGEVFLLVRQPFSLGFLAGVLAVLLVLASHPQKKRARRSP
ncbi:hypothetical protein GF367_01090 [Candidatus Woesearchaeota archaeon]|nr:hypothetical protein [Candidatus Woesearchaeota archaeon]